MGDKRTRFWEDDATRSSVLADRIGEHKRGVMEKLQFPFAST